MSLYMRSRTAYLRSIVLCLTFAISLIGSGAQAQVTAFMQAVAEASSGDAAIAAFYKANGYQPIWTGTSSKDKSRRSALLKALASADDHGLPAKAYDLQFLEANLRAVKSERDLGKIEVALSRLFLEYAADVQTGVLTPGRVDPGLVMQVPLRGRTQTLAAFAKSSPDRFLKSLPPSSPEYTRLMKAKFAMEKQLGKGGWGPAVPAKKLEPGQSGAAVVAMRNRLIAMGYMRRNAGQVYDGNMQAAVQQFQLAHGLSPDGVAGSGTLAEINVSARGAAGRDRRLDGAGALDQHAARQASYLGEPYRFHRADRG